MNPAANKAGDVGTPIDAEESPQVTDYAPGFQATEQLLLDTRPPVEFDDWELEDDLRAVRSATRAIRESIHDRHNTKNAVRSVDPPHTSPKGWHVGQINRAPPVEKKHRQRRKRHASWLSWTLLSLGLMTFVCGGVLLGWSVYARRSELWDIGLPLALGGLAALFVGLLFQLEGLWRSNTDTTNALDRLDEQLDELRHTTALLGTTHSEPAKSFYLHMSDGASPQILLADLKGQLDLLALKMDEQRRSA